MKPVIKKLMYYIVSVMQLSTAGQTEAWKPYADITITNPCKLADMCTLRFK
jgi:hypothetical protein